MSRFSLHRCRFVDYPPSPITALAFSHPSSPTCLSSPPKALRLAIGRNNGAIEIWDPLGGIWHHESTLYGGTGRSIEGLAWTCDSETGALRLFSIGYSTSVTEWNLASGVPAAHINLNGGVLWSIAVQSKDHATASPTEVGENQFIVVGTDDGSVKLISTAGGPGQLTLVRNMAHTATGKAPVLSLAWKDKNTVVAGMADSTIRVWDVRSGCSTARMSLNKECGREVLVWAIKITRSGEIISGDSRGEVCFWDGKTHTLRQRVRAHKADVLALEVAHKNGETVISSGVDMRTVIMKVGERRWSEASCRRYHKYDVRAMATYECGKFSILVSGGLDINPIVIPLEMNTKDTQRTLPLVPQQSIITTVPESRLLMSFWEREIKIWRINKISALPEVEKFEEECGGKLVSRIVLSSEEYITSAVISPVIFSSSSYILAVATVTEVKLFHLRISQHSRSQAFRVFKITTPATFPVVSSLVKKVIDVSHTSSDKCDNVPLETLGARLLVFSPDGRKLACITTNSRIFIFNISCTRQSIAEEKPDISVPAPLWELMRDPLPRLCQGSKRRAPCGSKQQIQTQCDCHESHHGAYLNMITRACFSTTSRFLAVADLAGNISIFTYGSSGWSACQNAIPKFSSAISILSFRPLPTIPLSIDNFEDHRETLLVIPVESNHILEFSVPSGVLSLWSRQNPMPRHMPAMWSAVTGRAVGAFWESSEKVWIWSGSWVWMFDLSRDWPMTRNVTQSSIMKKRKRVGVSSDAETKKDEVSPSSEDEDDGMGIETKHVTRICGARGQPPFWGCWRWRNLLGFSPIGFRDRQHAGRGHSRELCVVERPTWDVDMSRRV